MLINIILEQFKSSSSYTGFFSVKSWVALINVMFDSVSLSPSAKFQQLFFYLWL
jgi:hypothetical protein